LRFERYAQRRGIDAKRIGWYEAFAVWKIAVITQQIYIRFLRGQTRDERFSVLGERVEQLVQIARDVASGSS